MSKRRKSNLISYVAIACFLSLTATSELQAFSLSPPRDGERPARKSERKRPSKGSKSQAKKQESLTSYKEKKYDLLRESFEALLDSKEPDASVQQDSQKDQITDSRFEPEKEVIGQELPSVDSKIHVFPNLSRLYKKSFLRFLGKEAAIAANLNEKSAGNQTQKAHLLRQTGSNLAKLVNDSFATKYQDSARFNIERNPHFSFEAKKEHRSIAGLIYQNVKHLNNPSSLDKMRSSMKLARLEYEAEHGCFISSSEAPAKSNRMFEPSSKLTLQEITKDSSVRVWSEKPYTHFKTPYQFDKASLTKDQVHLDFALPKVGLAHIHEAEFEPKFIKNSLFIPSLVRGENLAQKVSRDEFKGSGISLDSCKKHHTLEYVENEVDLRLVGFDISKEWNFDNTPKDVNLDHILDTESDFYRSAFTSYFAQDDALFPVADFYLPFAEHPFEKPNFAFDSRLQIGVVTYYGLKHLKEAKLTKENPYQAAFEDALALENFIHTEVFTNLFLESELKAYHHTFTPRNFKKAELAYVKAQSPILLSKDTPFVNLFRNQSLMTLLETNTPGQLHLDSSIYYTKTPHVFSPIKQTSTIAYKTSLPSLTTYYGLEVCEAPNFSKPSYILLFPMKHPQEEPGYYLEMSPKETLQKTVSLVAALLDPNTNLLEANTPGKLHLDSSIYFEKTPHNFSPVKQASTIAFSTSLPSLTTYYGLEVCEIQSFIKPSYILLFPMKRPQEEPCYYLEMSPKGTFQKTVSLVAALVDPNANSLETNFDSFVQTPQESEHKKEDSTLALKKPQITLITPTQDPSASFTAPFALSNTFQSPSLRDSKKETGYSQDLKKLTRMQVRSLIAHAFSTTQNKIKVQFATVPKVNSSKKFAAKPVKAQVVMAGQYSTLATVYDPSIHMPSEFKSLDYPLEVAFVEVAETDFEKYLRKTFSQSDLAALDQEESIKELGFKHYLVERLASEQETASIKEDLKIDQDFLIGQLSYNKVLDQTKPSESPNFSPFTYRNITPNSSKDAEFLEYGKLFMERLSDAGMDFAFDSMEGLHRATGHIKHLCAAENPRRWAFNPFTESEVPETTWSYGVISDDFMIATTYEDYDFKDFYSLVGKVHFAFNNLYYQAPKIEVLKEYSAQDYYHFAFSHFLIEHSQEIATGIHLEAKLNQLECWSNPNFETTHFLAHENLFIPDIEGHSLIMDIAEESKTSKLPQLITQSQQLPGLINAATAFVPSVQKAISSNQNYRHTQDNLHTLPSLAELNTTTFSTEFGADIEIIPNHKEGGYLFAIKLDVENKQLFERPPQNFVFMMDRSGAIDKNRFQVFKQAVAKALMYLKEGDTFNIVTFDNEITPMSKEGVFYSASTKHGAKRFLETQKRSYKYALPDIYDVLLHANHLAKHSELPTTVFLLTNGKTLEEFDTQSEVLSQIVSMNKDHFSLFTACASSGNNNLMLEIISNLNKGEFLHSQTHAAFPRKFAAFVKHASHLMANNIHVTAAKSDQNVHLEFYPNTALASNLYIDKPYTIIGKIDRLSDFELIVQGKFGEQWLNLKKNISFKHAKKGGRYIQRDYGMHIAYNKYKEFLKEGNTVCLDEAKQVLKPLNLSSIY